MGPAAVGRPRREQVAAARATERADIAAHLHDSVLQTLALIQRQSGDAAAVTRLARAQERELRSWLYAGPQGPQSTLAAAVTEVAHDVEDLHGVAIDLVVTGDRRCEPHGAALVQAMREALLNAVRHGGSPVTAYVEIGPTGVEAFVRDRGDGFDLDAVPADRLGVRSRSSGGWSGTGDRRACAAGRTGPRWSSGCHRSKEDHHEHTDPAGGAAPAVPRVVLVDDHRMFRTGVRRADEHAMAARRPGVRVRR